MTAALLLDLWKTMGTVAAGVTLPGSAELLILSVASLFPLRRSFGRPLGMRVAVVVPAHNESASIASCVESLLAADRAGMCVEIYVIADNCTDDTGVIAAGAGASVLVRTNHEERGKGYALDFAFTRLEPLGHDCVLVVDADTVVAHDFIVAMARAMRNGADAVQARYTVRDVDAGPRTRIMGLALRAFNVVRPRGRQQLGISVGILGNGFGLTRETLDNVPYLASSVVEDLEYHHSLVESGRRVRFVDETSVFGEIPVRGEGVKTQRSRWEGGRFRMIAAKGPKLLQGVLRGRFTLLEPLLELLLLPLAFHVVLLLAAVCTPIAVVRSFGLAGLGIVALHVAAAVLVDGGSWRDAGAIAMAPLYVLWKLSMVPALLRSARANHAWERTQRNAERNSPCGDAPADGS